MSVSYREAVAEAIVGHFGGEVERHFERVGPVVVVGNGKWVV